MQSIRDAISALSAEKILATHAVDDLKVNFFLIFDVEFKMLIIRHVMFIIIQCTN